MRIHIRGSGHATVIESGAGDAHNIAGGARKTAFAAIGHG